MKTRQIKGFQQSKVEVGQAFGLTGQSLDDPDGVYLTIEQDTHGTLASEGPTAGRIVHLAAPQIRRLRKVLKRALDVLDPPAPKPELPGPFDAAIRIETFMEGEIRVGPASTSKPTQPLLFVSLEKNTWDKMSLGEWQVHGSPVFHLTEEQFDALVEAGNRRFGRA